MFRIAPRRSLFSLSLLFLVALLFSCSRRLGPGDQLLAVGTYAFLFFFFLLTWKGGKIHHRFYFPEGNGMEQN
jgi:hypothetical protein